MNYERQKAIMLAENIHSFIKFIQKNQKDQNDFRMNTDRLYQIKLITEDFKFHIIADELIRINQFDWDGKYTYYLIDQFNKGMEIIGEYVKNHYHDLFLITGRIHTLKNLTASFSSREKT